MKLNLLESNKVFDMKQTLSHCFKTVTAQFPKRQTVCQVERRPIHQSLKTVMNELTNLVQQSVLFLALELFS